jgi:hypothetical protein
MAALSLVVNASGVGTPSVTALLMPEEIDSAAIMTPNYRPAGK